MKRRVTITAVALLVAFVMSGAMAYAGRISVDIPFPFLAGGKDWPAGKYTIDVLPNGRVQLTGPGGNQVFLPSVITMLGRHDRDADPELVFDKVDGKACLSEVWEPGKDGLLLLASKGTHDHLVVGGSNPRK